MVVPLPFHHRFDGPESSPEPFPAPTPRFDPGDPLDRWRRSKEEQATAKLRVPAILAAQRLALSSSRCRELAEHTQELRNRLLNLPGWTTPDAFNQIEGRVHQFEQELHRERLALLKDLSGLLETSSDAAVEAMRSAWLGELLRSVGGGGSPE